MFYYLNKITMSDEKLLAEATAQQTQPEKIDQPETNDQTIPEFKKLQTMKQKRLDELLKKANWLELMRVNEVEKLNELIMEINDLNWFEIYQIVEIPENEPQTQAEQVEKKPSKAEKKTEEPCNKDKIDAIFEMLPMIRETYSICQFMLENKWFNTAYKWYMDKDSQRKKTEELYAVLDYYWILRSEEKNIELLYTITFHKQEHIEIICKYFALEWLEYDRSKFILKPIKHEKETKQWYEPIWNPQFSKWTP